MKYRTLVSAVLLMLCSCGREEGPNDGGSTKAGPLPINPGPVPATEIMPDKKVAPGDAVPAMSDLGDGTFTELGLIDAFEQATGMPLPNSIKPKSGKFRVWNEKDYGGRNRSYHTATFVAPPDEVLALADAIESKWKAAHGENPEISLSRGLVGEGYNDGVKEVHRGTISLVLNEKYASYKMIAFTVSLDPVNGIIELTSYRGTEDTPSNRQDEADERRQEERDAKAQAEADAQWSKKPGSK